jgi:hypothetical protein
MQQLRGKLAELRGELESFSKGVVSRLQPVRTEVDALHGKFEAAVTSLRPMVKSVGGELSGKIDKLDAELAEMEP